MWELFAGMGKSRIIAWSVLTLLHHSPIKNVHIVIPIKSLMERDKNAFADYWIISCKENRVHYHSDLNFASTLDDITIIDEADFLLFKDPKAFGEAIKSTRVICMTATMATKDPKLLERDVFYHMKFKQMTHRDESETKLDFTEEWAADSAESLKGQVQTKAEKGAVLIYCDEPQASVLDSLLNTVRITTETDH